jgi:hypothetical protein
VRATVRGTRCVAVLGETPRHGHPREGWPPLQTTVQIRSNTQTRSGTCRAAFNWSFKTKPLLY